MRIALKVWGWLSLACGGLNLALMLYAASSPTTSYNSGSMGWAEWVGMGLLSLGLARILDLLEKNKSA